MSESASVQKAASNRRTFAIISHPDAGKTTMTEKLLLLGKAILLAGTVKAKKSGRYATSDWMAMEKERGISVTTSVMQFPYANCTVNLLDTPGHEDFSEDTYRTLSAVDAALMLIDGAKGVEPRTIRLMEVCRMRDTPIFTFINKLDREVRDPIELLDEVESVLKIRCCPMTWPIGMGRGFKGVYSFADNRLLLRRAAGDDELDVIEGLHSDAAHTALGYDSADIVAQIEFVKGASDRFDLEAFLAGRQTPVYFGTALGNFGVREMLDDFVRYAPSPQARRAVERVVEPAEERFTGFVFKIQANMDPKHRDRIAFLRVCSGHYRPGMRLMQVRTGKEVRVSDAVTFMAGDRNQADDVWPGDILGLYNHGSIQIGDTFTEGESLRFVGVPNFAPELFRRVRPRDPLRSKQLEKGLIELAQEGASQVFRPLDRNDIVVGAVGTLQFDVVAYRLQDEYRADPLYEPSSVYTARWIESDDPKKLSEFRTKHSEHLALDSGGHLAYLAPSRINLQLTQERWPEIRFLAAREH